MKQFDKHADAYNVVRGKIAYPDSLYRNLAERARHAKRRWTSAAATASRPSACNPGSATWKAATWARR